MASATHVTESTVDVKSKDPEPPNAGRGKKVFVGGLDTKLNEKDLLSYFEQFGKIVAVDLKRDKEQDSRGFGFVTFESEEVVEKVVDIHFHPIGEKTAEAKRAQPKAPVRQKSAPKASEYGDYEGYSRGHYAPWMNYGYVGYPTQPYYDNYGYDHQARQYYGPGNRDSRQYYGSEHYYRSRHREAAKPYYRSGATQYYGSRNDTWQNYGPESSTSGHKGYSQYDHHSAQFDED